MYSHQTLSIDKVSNHMYINGLSQHGEDCGVSAQTKADSPCRKMIHSNLERLGEPIFDRPYDWLQSGIPAFAGGANLQYGV
jgi:hypothetical protein